MTLQEYLGRTQALKGLQKLILKIAGGCVEIAGAISGGNVSLAGTENASGEKQLALDVGSDEILSRVLEESGLVSVYASEELDEPVKFASGRQFVVASDPLDGSSLVDVNLAVGTIVGIYEGDHFLGRTGDEQVAAMVAVYGPRTTILLTVREGTYEFLFNGEEFIVSRDDIDVAEEGKMFAPGNLRATKFNEKYLVLLNYWAENQYKLRYSGGMVPDVGQIMLKGKGIFAYPGYHDAPNGKLRLLYECAPLSLLMEQAGGKSTDGSMRILDKKIEGFHHRTPILIGSKGEVDRAEGMLR